ncbi:YncE family protein, partial [Streptomyces sp. UNOB3_S3]|uniref:YncE family protein n=1 Tax=Streptomyces sp. UNOB3_S3 TaxID=2871682 RepID=UPI001E384D91
PPTRDRWWHAEHDVATLPPATFPEGDQHPPHQEDREASASPKAVVPVPRGEPRAPGATRPYARSRIAETGTTHKDDFPHGTAGTLFPGIQHSATRRAPRVGTHVYAAGIVSNTISVVDPANHTLVAALDAGTNPFGTARTPDGAKLYISNSGANNVSVLDTARGEIVSTVTVGPYPHGLAPSPDGAHLYVADTGPATGPGGSRTVSVIDTGSDTVTTTWRTGPAPRCLATAPDGTTLYVTCSDGLHALDTRDGDTRWTLTGLTETNGVAVHPDGGRVYVVNTLQNTLTVVDTGNHRAGERIRVGRTPWQVALSPDGARLYVTGAGDDSVTVIDSLTHRVLATVRVKHVPTGITATADTIWVSTNASSTVDAIDAKTLEVTGSTPLGLATSPSGLTVA